MKRQTKDYIELCNFLKIIGITKTGGQSKILIRSGQIKVNGIEERRNKCKLRDGDCVEYGGEVYTLDKAIIK